MKKTLALLMFATMLFSVGCGNQAQDAAKDAQQKVEQKADEVKKDAEQKVDEAKDKANEVKEDAAKKAEEVKDASIQAADEAAKKAEELKSDATAKLDEAKESVDAKVDELTSTATTERVVALGGLMPGVSVDEVKAMFGDPTSTEGNVLTFADGLKVVLDSAQKVKSISTLLNAFDTPEGMYVGASEYSLNDNCGPADVVRKIERGAEYEYNSGDKKTVVIYKAQDGVITEIICSTK